MSELKKIKAKELYIPNEKINNNQIIKTNYLIKPEINKMSTGFFVTLAVKVLSPLLSLITTPIKTELDSFIKSLYVKAKNTDSPIDDMFIKLLADILGIEVK